MANAINILISIQETGASVINSVNAGMKQLQQSSKAYQDTLNSLNGYANSFNQGLQRMVGLLAGVTVAKGFIDTAASFEKTKLMLEGLMGSASEAEKSFAWIKDFATKTPFDMDALSDSFVKFKAAGLDPTDGSLKSLTNAVAAFGGSSEDLKLTTLAITQMMGKGTVQSQELKLQLGEKIPTAIKIMARELGKTIPQLLDMVESGSLEASVGVKALLTGFDKDFGSAGERMMSGWLGLMAQLKTAWQSFEDMLMKAGVFDQLKTALSSAIQQIKSDEFISAAKTMGTIIAEIIKDLVDFAKYLLQLGETFSPVLNAFGSLLPVLVESALAWAGIRLAFTAVIGLPISIYREILALNNGFTALMGMNFASWLQSAAAAITTLTSGMSTLAIAATSAGLALAVVFTAKQISDLAAVYDDWLKLQKEVEQQSKKYATMAKEFEAFKVVKVRGLAELLAMEDAERQKEYEALQQSLAYWIRYRAQLETNAEKTKFGGLLSTDEAKKAQQELPKVQQKIDELMAGMEDMGRASRATGQSFDDFRDSAAAAKKGMDSTNQSGKQITLTFDEAKRAIDSLSKEQERTSKLAAASFDFQAERAKAMATDEKAAAAVVLEEYRRKKDYLIAQAEEGARRQMEILNQTNMKAKGAEKEYADEAYKIEQGLTAAKAKAVEDWLSAVKSAHIQALTAAKKYGEEIKAIDRSINENQLTGQQMLRDIKREGMTEEQAWNDRRRQAYQELAQAQDLIAKAGSPEELKDAIAIAEKARQEFRGLSTEVKDGDNVVISQQKAMSEASRGVRNTTEAITEALTKQRELTNQNREAEVQRAKSTYDEWQKTQQLLDTIGQMKVTPEVTFTPDTSAADAARERISQPITVPVNYQSSGAPSESGYARGGQLPGWGGGDRIRALLEAGEFVIRKEAVSRYGAGLFHALNSMRLNLSDAFSSFVPRIPELPKVAYATGGPVSYGTLRLQAGGVELPVQVAGPRGRDMVKEFEAALRKERLVKGR